MSPNQLDLVEKAIQEQSLLDAQASPPKSGKARQSRIARDGGTGGPSDYLGQMSPDFEAVLTGVEIYTEEHIPHLRSRWLFRCKDIMGGSPNRLPPLRVINHTIPLYDEDKKYNYYLPRCPDSLKSHLSDKIAKYLQSGWWETCQTDQAAPMLCVLKKSGGLRTVVDCRKRNENTRPDVTPFPDQDTIRLDVARAKYRSKIDFSDAYEQVRVEPRDVWKTAFATIYGTLLSHVMQQGDCNAPSTFQRIMNLVFRDYIGRFIHVYLDDVFVYSNTIAEHEEHLRLAFDKIREFEFYLKPEKCDLYAVRVDCLGHIIDDAGLHPDEDKITRIREWRTPRSYHDIQRFLGLVQYLAHFVPDLSAYAGPLQAMEKNGQTFVWRPVHDKCFTMIKELCSRHPILKPIDPSKPDMVWVICDASTSGLGAMYGQGPEWMTCRPAGFMSKKFTPAQHNYRVYEHEALAILEALLKWEDKLLGYKFTVVTDHRALEFFGQLKKLSPRQSRWMEYLSRFRFEIKYVKGVLNKVADCLSRYYSEDTPNDVHPESEYVNADVRIDPTHDLLSWERIQEIRPNSALLFAQRPIDRTEGRDAEAIQLGPAHVDPAHRSAERDPTVLESRAKGTHLREVVHRREEFTASVKSAYPNDPLLSKVLEKPTDYKSFFVKDHLIWTRNLGQEVVMCVPQGMLNDNTLTGIVIEQAHSIVGHFSSQKTADYIRRWYWWPKMSKMISSFCDSCELCKRSKGNYQPPPGKLHSLPVPTAPWDSIGMDFIGPFPEVDQFNYLWVVICRMTSMVHLIPLTTRTTATELSWIYLKEVCRLHGLPSSIVSDRDSKFTSKWWTELHRLLGVKLRMSTSFHPQTDCQTERVNRSIAQILRAVVSADQSNWVAKLPMVEFALNSSASSTTGLAPFEANYGFLPSMMNVHRRNLECAPGVAAFAEKARQNLADVYDAIIERRVFQTYHANAKRRDEPSIHAGDMVYLSTSNLALPKGRASKLLPKYIGPYKVIQAFPESSNYLLELPASLKARNIHPKFHASKLRPHTPNDALLFPNRAPVDPYDWGTPDDAEWVVDEITAHRWNGKHLQLQVRWNLGDTTWEPRSHCEELEALERYLELMNVRRCEDLPRRGADKIGARRRR